MKKIIFDLDGTLVDSMSGWASKIISILNEYNVTYPNDIVKILTPLGERAVSEYLVNLGVKMTSEQIMRVMSEYSVKQYTKYIPAKEGVIDALKRLKKEGYSLNVLTASSHSLLDVCLKRLNIFQIFDNVWSCDDFKLPKSDVNIYYEVAKRLNTITENCVFFDDNLLAVSMAKKSGMKVVGVYDESSQEFTDQIKKTCDKYVYKMSEIFE